MLYVGNKLFSMVEWPYESVKHYFGKNDENGFKAREI